MWHPKEINFFNMLKVCSRQMLHKIQHGEFQSNVHVGNTRIDIYFKCGANTNNSRIDFKAMVKLLLNR